MKVSNQSILRLKVTDQISAMVSYWDRELVCRFANPGLADWIGKSNEDIVGKITLKSCIVATLFEKNLDHIIGALNGITQTFERDIPLPNEGIRHVLTNYYPDMVNDEVLGFFAHVVDITEQNNAQTDLQHTNELLYNLFDESPAAIAISNLHDGKWRDVNKTFLELFEFESKEELIGKTVAESNILHHPEQRA